MKILIVTGLYPPDIGGPATYVSSVEDDLRAAGHEVSILTLGDARGSEYVSTIPRSKGFFARAFAIKRFVEGAGADLVFAQDPFSTGFGVALANTRARKVLKVVGDNAWEIARESCGVEAGIEEFQDRFFGPRVWLMQRVQSWTARQFSQIITPSNYLKGVVSGWGVDQQRISVVYNAVHSADRDLSKRECRERLGLSGDVFVYVGRLAPWKGVGALIDVFAGRDEQLLVIGDGTLFEQLSAKAQGHENISLLGRISNKKVREYLAAADGLLLNSGYEGFPHVVLEAFMEGTPALVSDVCGNPELVRDGDNGFLFSYDDRDSIRDALDRFADADKRSLRAGALRSAKEFSWQRMVSDLREVLE